MSTMKMRSEKQRTGKHRRQRSISRTAAEQQQAVNDVVLSLHCQQDRITRK